MFVNDSKILKEKEQKIEHLEKKLKQAEDSIQQLQKTTTTENR